VENPAWFRLVQVAERKGLLFYELLSKLRKIRQEFGAGAEWYEMALQSAIADAEREWQARQAEEIAGNSSRLARDER